MGSVLDRKFIKYKNLKKVEIFFVHTEGVGRVVDEDWLLAMFFCTHFT